jgi:hypothetical protein
MKGPPLADGKIVKPSGGKWSLGVALPSTIAQGTNGIAISKFCENRDVSPIYETVRCQGKEYWIYRFSKREDADDFCKIFGGKLIQPHGPD